MRASALLWLVVLVLGAHQACTNDFRQFEFDLEPGGQAPGGSGAGGGLGGSGAIGGAPECSFPYDCPGEDTQCRGRTCQNGRCGISSFQAGLHCAEEGGEVCDGMGNCVLGTCVDDVHSGQETAVDCGGPDCDPCGNGAACLEARDCTSRFCDRGEGGGGSGDPGVCHACSNAEQCVEEGEGYCDGDPPEQHPGGQCDGFGTCTAGAPSPCAPYQCNVAATACLQDCATGGIADCYGATYCDSSDHCVAQKDDGQGCGADSECLHGHCVDDVCCAAACDGLCEACSAAKKGTGADGVCGYVAAGSDPDTECLDALVCSSGSCI